MIRRGGSIPDPGCALRGPSTPATGSSPAASASPAKPSNRPPPANASKRPGWRRRGALPPRHRARLPARPCRISTSSTAPQSTPPPSPPPTPLPMGEGRGTARSYRFPEANEDDPRGTGTRSERVTPASRKASKRTTPTLQDRRRRLDVRWASPAVVVFRPAAQILSGLGAGKLRARSTTLSIRPYSRASSGDMKRSRSVSSWSRSRRLAGVLR